MTHSIVAALLLLPLLVTAAPRQEDSASALLDQFAADFIETASRSWSDYRVCEYRSKTDDKRDFLGRSFGRDVFPANAHIRWKELQVSETGDSRSLHLGLVAVTFQDPAAANRVYAQLAAEPQPYLLKTKIRTRYKALIRGDSVVILYSETHGHESLKRFFEAVDKLPG
ncbi:hypothetical protein [Archangium primigenium]|uniref:hypothetical protein n=1 Tax=[Archangium] primigenium TaxID=2792470 RepID=UPI001959A971|nr:hypothetical protein [Archangium primigenium]MBM7112510.1 hypothetical protein [Archangium primigenium]